MKLDVPPVINKKQEKVLKPFEQIKSSERELNNFFLVDFKDKHLISSLDDNQVLVLNNEKAKDLTEQYTLASQGIWENDPEKIEAFEKIEKQLYSLGRPLGPEDFQHVKDLKDEDLELFNKVFGSHKFNFDVKTWGITLDETLMFLRYTKDSDQKDFDRILKFKENFGVEPFLSIIHGGKEMGDKIMSLSEKLPEDTAKLIFSKYREVVDSVQKIENFLSSFFREGGSEKIDSEKIKETGEQLLNRGKDLLVRFSEKAEKNTGAGEIIKDLERVQIENELFLSTFKVLKKRGGIVNFDEIKNTSFEIIDAERLTAEEAKVMIEIYKMNAEKQYDSQYTNKLLLKFEEATKNPKSKFYIFKYKNKIQGFVRFDKLDKNRQFAASFNIAIEAQNSRLGEMIIDQAIKKEAENSVLEANCVPDIPNSAKYIESGFVGTKNYTDNNQDLLWIEWNNKFNNEKYKTKKLNQQEIIDLSKESKRLLNIKIVSSPKQAGIPLNSLNEGFVLTRYFFNEEEKKMVCGF